MSLYKTCYLYSLRGCKKGGGWGGAQAIAEDPQHPPGQQYKPRAWSHQGGQRAAGKLPPPRAAAGHRVPVCKAPRSQWDSGIGWDRTLGKVFAKLLAWQKRTSPALQIITIRKHLCGETYFCTILSSFFVLNGWEQKKWFTPKDCNLKDLNLASSNAQKLEVNTTGVGKKNKLKVFIVANEAFKWTSSNTMFKTFVALLLRFLPAARNKTYLSCNQFLTVLYKHYRNFVLCNTSCSQGCNK